MRQPSNFARAFYVINVAGKPWNLTAGDPQSVADCRDDIAWQERGGEPRTAFAIAYWDADTQTFQELNGTRTFEVDRGPYTIEAHARHMAALASRP